MNKLLPILLATTGLAGLSYGQTTIFYEDFSGSGALNGESPTTGSGTTWFAEGSVVENGSGTTNAIAASTSNTLAFTLEAGNIYELSVDMVGDATPGTASKFAGFGFINKRTPVTSPFSGLTPTTPWAFLRTQNSSGVEGDMSLRPLGGSTDEQVIDSNFDVTVLRNYTLVLNTNDTDVGTIGSQFSLSYLVDGVEWGSYTYTDAQSTDLLSNVAAVGFTTSTAGGPGVTFDNFKLTVIPEPGTYALLLGLAALTTMAVRRRSSRS